MKAYQSRWLEGGFTERSSALERCSGLAYCGERVIRTTIKLELAKLHGRSRHACLYFINK